MQLHVDVLRLHSLVDRGKLLMDRRLLLRMLLVESCDHFMGRLLSVEVGVAAIAKCDLAACGSMCPQSQSRANAALASIARSTNGSRLTSIIAFAMVPPGKAQGESPG